MSGPPPARHIIRGERVFLRPAERADLPIFVRWLNDDDTASFLSVRAPMSLASEEKWFENLLEAQGKERWHFVICLVETGEPIGTLGLFDLDNANGSAGMGIFIGEKARLGQGLGSDAHNALLDFAFGDLRLERVWLDVYDYNPRARRSYEKVGYTLEGTKRHAVYKRGRYVDVLLMSILRDEWLKLERKRSWEYDAPDAAV